MELADLGIILATLGSFKKKGLIVNVLSAGVLISIYSPSLLPSPLPQDLREVQILECLNQPF